MFFWKILTLMNWGVILNMSDERWHHTPENKHRRKDVGKMGYVLYIIMVELQWKRQEVGDNKGRLSSMQPQ